MTKKPKPKQKPINFITLYLGLLVVLLFVVWTFKLTLSKPDAVAFEYNDLMKAIETQEFNGQKLVKLEITPSADVNDNGRVIAIFEDKTEYAANVPSIQAFMEKANYYLVETNTGAPVAIVTKSASSSGMLWSMLFQVVFVIVLFGVFFFMLRQMQGGGANNSKAGSFGKSKAKKMTDDKNKITFDNVAGLCEERKELEELVDFLKHPGKYVEVGARIPKGILLVGPPGTGKTLLAKAVSGEANVPFYTISGSDFVELYVGVGASRVRDLFETAKKNVPCLIFIDEIDAVGRRRGTGLGGSHDEREQTLNQLLVEMDGFGVNEGVIILAATNRPDVLDPALLRPGRFDRKIVVNTPDVKGREDILKIHATGKSLDKDVDLGIIARTTPGFTGADLENLLNEAALLTAREGKTTITMEELRKAFIKVGVGTEKKSRAITEREKKLTAYHEVGHAIVRELLTELEPVHIVSVIPTGMAGGYTMHLPEEDKMYALKSYMESTIVSILGGRAAEEVIFGDISTGASSDIERATSIARNMVTKYGMSERLGPIQFGSDSEEVFLGKDLAHARNYGEEIASIIDSEIKRIIGTAYETALRLIRENIDSMHKAVEVLMTKEKITGDEFREILGSKSSRVVKKSAVADFLTEPTEAEAPVAGE